MQTKTQAGLISASIGAIVGAILFSIIKSKSSNRIVWVIGGFVLFGTLSGVIAGIVSKEDYVQYMSEEDEEKTCRDGMCNL